MSTNRSNLIGNRYQILSRLGQGGMGIVYRALDRLRSQPVALKSISSLAPMLDVTHSGNVSASSHTEQQATAPQVPPPTASMSVRITEFGVGSALQIRNSHDPVALRIALSQEFRTLASLRHPHIITVLDYGFDAQHTPFFTMELLSDAWPILTVARDMAYPQQVELLLQVAQALVYLHRRGVLHRDLKPANILAQPTPQGYHVKVLDFGLATAKSMDVAAQNIVGTLAFMAPELLWGERPSEATDLYAFGVMAYELLARRSPFAGASTSDLVSAVLSRVPDTSWLAVPEPLRDLLNQLLAKDPAIRPKDASELCVKLAGAVGLSVPTETSTIRDSFLQAASFVARDEEVATLMDALDEGAAGRGSGWLVGGESGVGKSRLIDEVSTLARVRGIQVLRGETLRAGAAPYQAFRDVLRALLLQVECDDSLASLLLPLVPDLPVLLQRELVERPAVDAKSAQERLLRTIDDCFGLVRTPTLVIIEDVHWAGVEVILTLSRLMRRIRKRPLVIIASYRDDEAPWVPSALPAMEPLRLARLDRASVTALSQSMLGPLGGHPDLIELLLRETEGNAFFMVEVLRSLAEERGMLSEIASNRLPDRVFAGGMRAVLERRLSRVPAKARPLLHLAAVAGRQLDLPLLRSQEPQLNAWLEACANVAVLETVNQGWRFTHDKLRERLLEELSPDERRQLHRKVAELLERSVSPAELDPSRLAYHYGEAGVASLAVHYATMAGERALREGAIEKSLTYLNDLRRWQEQLEAKTALAPGYRLAASALLALGRLTESGERCELAWATLGYPLPAPEPLTAALAKSIRAEVSATLAQRDFGPHTSKDAIRLALETIELAAQSIGAFLPLSQHSSAYRVCLLALGIVRRLELPSLRPFFAIHINYLHRLYAFDADPDLDLSQTDFSASLPINDDTLIDLRNRLDGLLSLQHGHFYEALKHFQLSIQTSIKQGNDQQSLSCLLQIAFVYYYYGLFNDALHESNALQARATVDGIVQFQAWGHTLNALALLNLNQPARSRSELDLARKNLDRINDPHCLLFHSCVQAYYHTITTNTIEAQRWIDRALDLFSKHLFVSHESLLAVTILAEVCVGLVRDTTPLALADANTPLAKTRSHMHRLVAIFSVGRPRALLLESAHALLEGRVRRGSALARLSLRHAQRAGMPYETALAHLVLSRLAPSDSQKRSYHEQHGREQLARVGLTWPPHYPDPRLSGKLSE